MGGCSGLGEMRGSGDASAARVVKGDGLQNMIPRLVTGLSYLCLQRKLPRSGETRTSVERLKNQWRACHQQKKHQRQAAPSRKSYGSASLLVLQRSASHSSLASSCYAGGAIQVHMEFIRALWEDYYTYGLMAETTGEWLGRKPLPPRDT